MMSSRRRVESGCAPAPDGGGCSIPSTAPRTTPMACPSSRASLGLEIDGRTEVGAVYDPSRRELFTAERGRGAALNGTPLRVSDTATLDRFAPRHRLSVRGTTGGKRSRGALRIVPAASSGGTTAGIRGARPLLCRNGSLRGLLGAASQALGCLCRRAHRRRGRRPRHRHGRRGVQRDGRTSHRVERSAARRDATRHP